MSDFASLVTFRHGFEDPNYQFSLSPDGAIVLFSGAEVTGTAGSTRKIFQPTLYSLTTGGRLAVYEGHNKVLRTAALSSSGSLAATLTDEGELRIWDVRRSIARDKLNSDTAVPPCAYKEPFASADVDFFDSNSDTSSCLLDPNPSYLNVLAASPSSQSVFVLQKTDSDVEILRVGVNGTVAQRAKLAAKLDDDALSFATRDRNSLLVLESDGRLQVVSLTDLGKIADTYPAKVSSVSRLSGGNTDEFLIADEKGDLRTINVKDNKILVATLVRKPVLDTFEALVKRGNEVEGLALTNEEARGRYFSRRDLIVYCADRGSTWTYNPVCMVLSSAEADKSTDRLCLAGRFKGNALFCLSADRKRLEAFDFAKKRWLTISDDDFAEPAHRIIDKVEITARPFKQCANRVVVTYHEHINGGGGIESPGALVFDMTTGKALMRLQAAPADADPGFCQLEDLLAYARKAQKTTTSTVDDTSAPAYSASNESSEPIARKPSPESGTPTQAEAEVGLDEKLRQYIETTLLTDRERYAATVDYYDHGTVSREFVQKDKEAYAKRWPARKYQLLSEGFVVSPQANGDVGVEFRYSFQVSNTKVTRNGSGAARVTLRPDAEDYEVLSAKENVQTGAVKPR